MTTTNTTMTMTDVTLGRSQNAINLQLLSFPTIDAEPSEKARPFDTAVDTIKSHLSNFDPSELATCLSNVVPGNHPAALSQSSSYRAELATACTSSRT